jgi:hypothetical protein
MEAAEVARIQSKFMVAARFPRVMADVQKMVLDECRRADFALVARYRRPQGVKRDENGNVLKENGKPIPNYIEGPSVRLIEAFLQRMRNIERSSISIYEDDRKRVIRYTVTDYEFNTSESREVTIDKIVERRSLKQHQHAIAERLNTWGDTVYLLPATADDVRHMESRMVAFARRDLGRLFVPKDLLDEAERECVKTLLRDAKGDPAAARNRMIANYRELGVLPEQLVEWFGGRALELLSDDDVLTLRIAGATIKEGEAKWAEIVAASPYRETAGDVDREQLSRSEELKKALAAKAAKAKEARKPPPPKPADADPYPPEHWDAPQQAAQEPVATAQPAEPARERKPRKAPPEPPRNAGDTWEPPEGGAA